MSKKKKEYLFLWLAAGLFIGVVLTAVWNEVIARIEHVPTENGETE